MPHSSRSGEGSLAEHAAFGKFWDEHVDRLRRFIESRLDAKLRQRVGPEDLLQEVFMRAAGLWAEYQRGSAMKPYPWLYRITLDALIGQYRTHSAKKRGLTLEVPLNDDCSAALGREFINPVAGPVTEAQKHELAAQVRLLVAALPAADRDILVMRYFDQLTTREMCEVVNGAYAAPTVTENTMNVRLFRALEKLKKLWQQLPGGPA